MSRHERLDQVVPAQPLPPLDVGVIDQNGVGTPGAAYPAAQAVELFAIGNDGQARHGAPDVPRQRSDCQSPLPPARDNAMFDVMPLESELVRRAATFAREAHRGHYRKDAQRLPYFVHLESVARRLAQHGHDEDEVLAAAYLHDVLEDRPAFGRRLRVEFPPSVVSIVEALTEVKLDANGNKRAKLERFEDYVAGLREDTPTTRRAIPISCADKLDNALSLVAAERRHDPILDRLTTLPEQHGPQLARMREIYASVVSPSLLAAFDEAVRELLEVIATRSVGKE